VDEATTVPAAPSAPLAAVHEEANGFLARLSPGAMGRLQPFLRKQHFARTTVLWESGEAPECVYFPVSGVVSVVWTTSEGLGVEVACIGREGAVLTGKADLHTRGTVQVAGTFLIISGSPFAKLASDLQELRDVLDGWNEWALLQARRTAVCNTLHSAQQRLCRWLLDVADRSDPSMTTTQEEIADRLGLRRTTVTIFAQRLQLDGIIRCRRGSIAILDRDKLKACACGCYQELDMASWPWHQELDQR